MRERLTTFALALVALLLVATLFLQGRAQQGSAGSLPTSSERRGNGLLGARNWLQGEGVRTLSLRERFSVLSERRDLPRSGNLLIVSLPAVLPFTTDEARALEDWTHAGNTLLVLAALADRPAWAQAGLAAADLYLLTGLKAQPRRTPAAAARQDPLAVIWAETQVLAEPRRAALIANREHPYLSGVASAVSFSDFAPRPVTLTVPRDGFMLCLAHERDSAQCVLWVRPAGTGTVIVSAFGSLISNRALGSAGNAQLLANIVATSVAPGGAVLFDDEHQGLAAAYDPAKFYRDPRLYATVAIIAAVWLVWVLGATQLKAPQARAAVPREAELVRATGAFLARVLGSDAAARRMYENFFKRLHAPTATRAAPPWEWLRHHPRLPRADVSQLENWYADARAGRRVPLARLHNLIVRTTRQLVA